MKQITFLSCDLSTPSQQAANNLAVAASNQKFDQSVRCKYCTVTGRHLRCLVHKETESLN